MLHLQRASLVTTRWITQHTVVLGGTRSADRITSIRLRMQVRTMWSLWTGHQSASSTASTTSMSYFIVGQAARQPGCQAASCQLPAVCLSVCLFLVSMFACLLVVSSWERHESTSTITLWSSSAASIVQMGASRGLRGLAPPALTDLLMSYLFANQSGLLLTFDFPKADQVSPFSSVIRLTWHCLLWRSADVCIELCNSLDVDFCKVLPRLCDGSTVIHDICSSSSSSSRPI